MNNNDINTFLESGCTNKPPKIPNTKWKICQNNPVEKEINK